MFVLLRSPALVKPVAHPVELERIKPAIKATPAEISSNRLSELEEIKPSL